MGFGLGDLGSMIGGAVGGIFGGPMGAQLGSMIGGQIGQMMNQLMGQFGMDNVAGGLSNCINQNAANIANQHVNNCGLPQFIQDAMREFIGNWLNENMQNIPSDCQHSCNHIYDFISNDNCSRDYVIRPGNEDMVLGGSTNSNESNNCSRSEASGTSSADSYRKSQNDAAFCNAENEAEDSKEGKSSKGNWLVALAGALAEVQGEFLTAAMKNMDTMRENSKKATQGTPPKNESAAAKETRQKAEESARNEFLMAQSHYQANMQMFNMVANMTTTSLKSLGEGLTSIARKQ
jgi:hypothetical protein